MQFKHPEILYFLFLLVIPILVHLFQLRRFKKQYFTNVKLLRELQQQTRKSKSIKKWLLLATRLVLLACLIIAFAQPFFNAKDAQNKANELVIILDNSFSMQAKGAKGELLKRNVQEILEQLPESQLFSLVTNDATFWDVDSKMIQRELKQLQYSALPFDLDNRLTQVANKKQNTKIDYIIITDAIGANSNKANQLAKENKVYFVQPKAQNKNNVAIKNVAIANTTESFYEIKITLKAYGAVDNEINLALYNDNKVTAKSQISFDTPEKVVSLSIPKNSFNGKVNIQDNSLEYDNTYYFSLSEPKKQNVLAIGNTDKNQFLKRILTDDEFVFTTSEFNQLDYNAIENQQTIILNELKEIPQALSTTLKAFYNKGGNIILIPSEESSEMNLNAFIQNFGNIAFSQNEQRDKQITKINFSHPIFKNVFEKKVTNFQYPKVHHSFNLSKNAFSILQYEDQSNFLSSITNKIGNLYVFSAAINKENSNFQNSPLIVPAIYNMSKVQSLNNNNTFTIGTNAVTYLDVILNKDEVVSVSNSDYSFIPQQQILTSKVKLSFGDYPEKAGNYTVTQKTNQLQNISFNYPRTESNLNEDNSTIYTNFAKINTIDEALNDLHNLRTDTIVWKWFLLATLLLLLIELLIQKFVK